MLASFHSKTTPTPLLLTYDNEAMYLHTDPQGCALYSADSPEPFYKIQEPLLLAHGIMTDPKTVHLVVLKTSGELCYTLISGSSTPQTMLIAKLDVRAIKYSRLFLFPQGKIIHIFYAHAHQSIRDLWHIEHRYWNGSSWHSVRMGEVVHPKEPLFHVNLDSQGDLHLLTITFQGQHSLLFTNRFNVTFHIWGSPTETLKISGEVLDMAALMTSDNVHYLYWVIKSPSGKFEIRWAQQTNSLELSSAWHLSPAPIKTLSAPFKGLGALEANRVIWLLAHAEEEVLMRNDGKGWNLVSSHTPFHHPFKWVHKGRRNFHQTYWLEDQVQKRAPAYYHELGFTVKKQAPPLPTPFQSIPPLITEIIPPVPAFYPDLTPPVLVEPTLLIANEVNSEISLENPSEDVTETLPLLENVQLEKLISTVDHLEEENADLSLVVETLLSKFDLVLGTISKHVEAEIIVDPAPMKETISNLKSLTSTVTHLEQENTNLSLVVETLLSKFNLVLGTISEHVEAEIIVELDPMKEAMSNLEKETKSLAQVLRVMMVKQEQSDNSLEALGSQLSQLQEENEELKNKGGFWSKWTM